MSELHVLTPRTVLMALLVSVGIAIAQCWIVYRWAGLDPNWLWVVMGISVVIIGWLMLGFWAVFPHSEVRSRNMIRGLMGIFAGTAVFTLDRVGAWTTVLLVAIGVLFLLSVLWPVIFKSRQS
jgi:hypothetical protein